MGKINAVWIIGSSIIAIAVIGIFVLALGTGSSDSDSGITGSVVGTGTIEIPLSELSGTAKFYEYESNGKTIRFFAVRASDGSIKTGFDECDVCYRSKKGYRQEGEYMVCNNCGNRYPIVGLGTENKNPGGCWPGYLPSFIEGDSVVIKNSDLDTGLWRYV